MKNYMKKQKVIERGSKSRLVRNLILLGADGLVGLSAGIINYLTDPQDESVFDKRARYLNTANEQMLQTQDPEIINGLNSVITDINNGVYDYK